MNNKINTEGNIEVDVDTSIKGVEKLEINSEAKIEPIVVKYCESCHFPEEYCEYSHTLLLKKLNQIVEEPIKEEKKEGETKTEEAKTEAKPDKKKSKEKTQILIELSKRGKKKHVTYVFNLEKFGLNMKDVAKLFSKKFACSSTVTKEDNGQEQRSSLLLNLICVKL